VSRYVRRALYCGLWLVAALAVVAVFLVGGCGMSTGGGDSASPTAMQQPIGPAAPPAARAAQPGVPEPVEQGVQIAVFLRPVAGEFEKASLSFESVSLLRVQGKPVDLKAASPEEVKRDGYGLVGSGGVPDGKYEGLILHPIKRAESQTLTVTEGHRAVPVRMPESLELKFEPVEVNAGNHPALVVTLDLADQKPRRDVEITAQLFKAGPLSEKQAGELKGQVAPPASLARVYACWAKTGAVVAMTQADAFGGDYALPGLAPGEYYVRVSAAGHQTYQEPNRPVTVTPGRTVDLPAVVLSSAQVAGSR